jgi:hypothetical protein
VRSSACERGWRLGLGLLCTLLAYGVAAPQAHAGCGDPTVVMWPNGHAAQTIENQPLPHPFVPGPRPCSGPHCSRSPGIPLVPPVTVAVTHYEWACLTVVDDTPNLRGSAHRLEDDPLKPIFRTFLVYHPPR